MLHYNVNTQPKSDNHQIEISNEIDECLSKEKLHGKSKILTGKKKIIS